MVFSKSKFSKNASKGTIRQLGNHSDVLNGMEVDFSAMKSMELSNMNMRVKNIIYIQ